MSDIVTAREEKESEQEEAARELRALLKPGDTVYTVLRQVSRSGMLRRIGAFVIRDNEPCFISHLVARVLNWRWCRDTGGVIVTGCGMDMGYHLVYNLGRALWPNGAPKYRSGRNGAGGPEKNGGYCLKQRWL